MKWTRIAGLATLLATGAPAQERPIAAELRVAADRPGPTIDRNIFGQFAEHLGTGIYGGVWVGRGSAIPNVRGIRSDVVAALRAIRVPNVRWPGGCFADEYHWRGGIGPAAGRRVSVNTNWGGVPEPGTFGTHEFMDFAEQVGADAFVSVNVGSGSPQEAAEWLEYMTATPPTSLARERAGNGHPAAWKVAILGLGNENWGCGGSFSPDHYVEEMKRYSRFVRNFNPAQHEGAAAMKKVAVGYGSDKEDYLEPVMKAWAGHNWAWDIDAVSIHNYSVDGWPPHLPSTGFGLDDYARLLADSVKMEPLIARQAAIMDRYDPAKKVGLAIDEWGAWLAPTPGSNPGFLQQQNSLRDAILASLNLDIFVRHADRVRMTNIAQMVNVLQAMILTDGPRMVLTPTYHVYKMYLPFQGATALPVQLDAGTWRHGTVSLRRVDAMAARGSDGRLWLALTNVDPERAVDVSAAIGGAPVASASGQVLTAGAVDAVNTFAAPNVVRPLPIAATVAGGRVRVTLPAKSVAVLELR